MALLVIAAVSAAYVTFSQRFGDNAKVMAAATFNSDRVLLRRMLTSAVDCNASMRAALCPGTPGRFPTLFRKLPKGGSRALVVGGSGKASRIGRWALRAECSADQTGFVVRATRLAKSGSLQSTSTSAFLPDPRLGTRIKWSDPESILFDSQAPLCWPHTEASTAPVLPNVCSGVRKGAWCTRGYYADIKFAKPYPNGRPPRVLISQAKPLQQKNSCSQNSTDRNYVDAANVTSTGFRLWCSSSPRDAACATPDAALWVKSSCNWVAFEQ